MAKRTKFKKLSKRARKLLAEGESKFVDYKSAVSGLHSDDLVAFANAESGGAILIGVKEVASQGGLHQG